MARNTFTNPATGTEYAWPINHDEEQEVPVGRNVEVMGRTGGGYVLQQAPDGPLVLSLEGTILHQTQLDQFRSFVLLCRDQTIYFTDFAGDSFEVLITEFKPRRLRTHRNSRVPGASHYWRYTLTMTVVRVRAGSWVGFA